MSQYVVLSQVEVQNANSIAGFTWGFPAVTQFLGFTHALDRKISQSRENWDMMFTGCAIISHKTKQKVYQPKDYADYEFLQSKNPPVLAKHKDKSPPIIEEGKMNLTVSLVIELADSLLLNTEGKEELEWNIEQLCYSLRLAGGTILKIGKVELVSSSTEEEATRMLRRIKRLTTPGFLLLDRSELLEEYYRELKDQEDSSEFLQAWLDFIALKSKAYPILKKTDEEPNETTPANWEYLPKPRPGYLVPLMMGYKAISELYAPGEVLDTRDTSVPSRFVEAVHSVGEWKSMHSMTTEQVSKVIWKYYNEGEWYLCKQKEDVNHVETFISEDEKKWEPIELFERRNRAVKSNFKQEVLEDEDELQKQIAESNLSWGDDASLSHQHDTLKIAFSLRIVSGIEKLSACNKPEFEQAFAEHIGNSLGSHVDELSKRYAYNIANARFMWRNRIEALALNIVVSHTSLENNLIFDAYDFPLNSTTSSDSDILKLAELIKKALLGEERVLLNIEAYAQLGEGQRVWPSQEMVLNISKGEKSRHLFSLNGVAAMHSEKIGNALRTIDDWYPTFNENGRPIAIEAYGSVTQRGKAYRSNKTDFRTLLLKWLNDKEVSESDKHFVVAMLIRGGVFGEGES
jgi:CRISPR type I-F-associated protein Csy3/CRISPR type I-F-associated protein Csy2